VAVFNAPYSNTRSVVELAICEIIALARRLTDRNRDMHAGVWDKSAIGSHEVRGRTLGLVGYGNIGAQLSVLAEALGMRVLFYDIADRLALGNAVKCDSLDELLERAETISLHVDGRAENEGIFGAAEFAKMRPRSLFLNLCRGHVVDLEALHDNLVSGHIAGAAIDVFPSEPKSKDEPFVSKLQDLPNVILTPHVGGSTKEAQVNIGRYVAGKLADYEDLGSTSMTINLPDVAAGPKAHARIVHLHHHVPGVMARLNALLAAHGMNIGSQTLSTRGQLGYAVTDVSGDGYDGLLADLEALDETVRVRVL
jgi:D-3-phosphoglycerate dehydrogenase